MLAIDTPEIDGETALISKITPPRLCSEVCVPILTVLCNCPDSPVGIPKNLAPLPKPLVTTPSSGIGYGLSGESGPTIIGRFSLDTGAISACGGAGLRTSDMMPSATLFEE